MPDLVMPLIFSWKLRFIFPVMKQEPVPVVPSNKYYYFRELYDPQTGEKTVDANWGAYYKGRTLNRDLKVFFGY